MVLMGLRSTIYLVVFLFQVRAVNGAGGGPWSQNSPICPGKGIYIIVFLYISCIYN